MNLVRSILSFLLAVNICSAAITDEQYRFVDTNNRPLPGVIIVCSYGLPNRPTEALEFRVSDSEGVATFTEREASQLGVNRSSRRAVWFIYSPNTHTGYPGAGRFFNRAIDSEPDADAIRENATNIIIMQDGTQQPTRWHRSVLLLMKTRELIRERKYGWDGKGIETIEAKLEVLARAEVASFLDRYGSAEVPTDYVSKSMHSQNASSAPTMIFREITPSFE